MKKLSILLLTLFLLGFATVSFAAEATEGLSAYFDLEFFNRFNNDPKLPTEAFRRYHLLTVDYSRNVWDVQLLYNWCDNVTGAVSVHEFTPWELQVKHRLNDKETIAAYYLYVNDLTGRGNHSSAARVDYSYCVPLDADWRTDLQLGAKLVDNSFLDAVYGVKLDFREKYHIGINYLNAMDDCLMIDKEHSSNIPVNIGTGYQLNEHTRLNLDLYGFLNKPENRPGLWFVTDFQFTLWE